MDIQIKRVIRIEEEPGLLCYDDCIATVANYYNCDYEMIYIDFCEIMKKNVDEKTFFASQYVMEMSDTTENLRKYCGIQVEEIVLNNDKEWISVIEQLVLKNKPILVFFDPYWCPWDNGFQKFHNDSGHSFIIKDIDIEKLIFTCVDPYFDIKDIDISFDYFLRGVKCINVFEKCNIDKIVEQDYKKILLDLYKNMFNTGYFHTLELLIIDIKQSNDLFNEVESDDVVWSSPIFVFFMLINQSISNLSTVTLYISEKIMDSKLKSLGQQIWNLSIQWKQVRKLLVKLYFIDKVNDNLKRKMLEKMSYVILELRKVLLYWLEGNELDHKGIFGDSNKIDYIDKGCLVLSLDEYFNNKGFDYLDNIYRADFTLAGHFYLINNYNDKKNIWCIDNILYNMNRIYSEKYDNISCEGQSLIVNKADYSYVHILGAAEFGGSTDIMKFEYEDVNEEIIFEFTDYIFEPQYGEKIAWKGQGVYCNENGECEIMQQTLYLYTKSYKIRKSVLKHIVLPINPSMHIFAITLANY